MSLPDPFALTPRKLHICNLVVLVEWVKLFSAAQPLTTNAQGVSSEHYWGIFQLGLVYSRNNSNQVAVYLDEFHTCKYASSLCFSKSPNVREVQTLVYPDV